jgi:predicted phosphodiesterase
LLGLEKLGHPIPRKTFKKLWWEKVNVDPQDLKPMPKARSIAVVSDTHLGHKRQQLTHLKEFYRTAKARGCDCVLHAGDLTDGLSSGHECERFLFTVDDVVNYVADNYPSGLDTFIIAGNHDNNVYKWAGVDICSSVASERNDFRYLGQGMAFFDLDKIKIFLGHDVCANASAGGLEGAFQYACKLGKQPDLVVNGHFHSWGSMPYHKGAFLFQPPCFQGQTDNMRLRKQTPSIGAAILHFNADGSRTIDCFHFDEILHDY